MALAAAIASTIGAGLSAIEATNALRQIPPLNAVIWLVVLSCFDAAGSLVAFALLNEAFGEVEWFTAPIAVMAAGLSGPALLRAQLALIGSGQEAAYWGPANRYRNLRARLESRIADNIAVSKSSWMTNKAMPCIAFVLLFELSTQVHTYLNNSDSLLPDDRARLELYLMETINGNARGLDKKRAIAQYLDDNGCYSCLKAVVRKGRLRQKADRTGALDRRLVDDLIAENSRH
ncbi:hypothetical protein [Nakamurella endophytica]|uniref:Uncharacterized protein n=1 Tax=Nakamurella endophytica TaxID=1748367 RepID=A0A917SZA4_9ACTN|nr:hypothetical protein [Nakamurella endophytica]GGM04645.1 hypothetical protein GCM10011594_26110 [Nakamurella endophytica]